MIEIIISLLLLLGAVFSLISTFGIIRFPDVYTRSHAATKSATLGVMSLLLGAFIYFIYAHQVASTKLLLGFIFVFVTSPVAGHMIARAAHLTGVPLWEKSVRDDLKAVYKKTKS